MALLGAFCAEHFLSTDWGSEQQRGTAAPVFFCKQCATVGWLGGEGKYEAFTGKLYFLEESKPLAKRRDEERFNFAVRSVFAEAGLGCVAFHKTISHGSQGAASGVWTDLLLLS